MSAIQTDIASYYSGKIRKFGATPEGVDWNGLQSQLLRFQQITKVLPDSSGFSLNDLGCGYGALATYLDGIRSCSEITYTGYDLSNQMIETSKSYCARITDNYSNLEFRHISDASEMQQADYSVASGIFSVKLERNDSEWLDYLLSALDQLDQASRRGFAFNCLTSYSDKDKMRSDLYYADPVHVFDFCKRHYSRNVALLHDYDLYEFTVLVRKPAS